MARDALLLDWISDDVVAVVLDEIEFEKAVTRQYVANVENMNLQSLCIGVSARNGLVLPMTYEFSAVF